MRLIDADELKVYLQEYLHYEHAIPWVDAQPTAYDVEKVVEELDEMAYTTTDMVCGGVFEAIRLSTAIEIVKGGGVE